jgi:hypothetical protein
MRKREMMLMVFAFVMHSGCGMNYNRTYTGTMSYSMPGQMGASSSIAYGTGTNPGSGSASISLMEASNVVSGSVSGQLGTGQITGGTPSGDIVSNVSVRFTPQSTTMGLGTMGTTSTMGSGCTYTGSLNVANNQISSSLTSTGTQGVYGSGSYTTCGNFSFTGTAH